MRSFWNPTGFFAFTMLLFLAALFSSGGKQKNSSFGKLPNCDAGTPQIAECTGPVTAVQLDGTGSTNPVPGPLTYNWELVADPRVTIDDPSSPTPTLYVDLQGICSLSFTAYLAVRNQFGVTSCTTTVTVQDTTAPALTCPADITVLQGDPTDPSFTGTATAVDLLDPAPAISYVDDLSQGPDVILRVWSADDGCQTSSCTQTITVEAPPPVHAHLDILPGSCPNSINVNTGAAMVSFPTGLLGNDFDVTQVDLGSMSMSRPLFVASGGPTVPPFDPEFGDAGTPFDGEPCGCNAVGADGILDLVLHFDKNELVDVFDLDLEPDGALVLLQIDGLLLDGTPFTAQDCVKIVNH